MAIYDPEWLLKLTILFCLLKPIFKIEFVFKFQRVVRWDRLIHCGSNKRYRCQWSWVIYNDKCSVFACSLNTWIKLCLLDKIRSFINVQLPLNKYLAKVCYSRALFDRNTHRLNTCRNWLFGILIVAYLLKVNKSSAYEYVWNKTILLFQLGTLFLLTDQLCFKMFVSR